MNLSHLRDFHTTKFDQNLIRHAEEDQKIYLKAYFYYITRLIYHAVNNPCCQEPIEWLHLIHSSQREIDSATAISRRWVSLRCLGSRIHHSSFRLTLSPPPPSWGTILLARVFGISGAIG